MKLMDFVNEYNKADDKLAYVKKCMTKTYINYTKKVDDCDKIVKLSCYDKDKNYRPSTTTQYFIFITTLIHRYLDIETNDELGMFDMFEQNGITETLVQALGSEYSKYSTILNMVARDTDSFENNLVRYFNAQSKATKIMLDEIAKVGKEETDNGEQSESSTTDVESDNSEDTGARGISSEKRSATSEG